MGLTLLFLKKIPVWAWAIFALVLWGGWGHHEATKYRKQVAVLEREKRAAQDEVSAIKDQQVKSNVEIAHAYTQVIQSNRSHISASNDELGRLRLALAKAPSCAASAAASARVDAAAVYATIAGECASALQAMGKDAIDDRSKLELLQAWVRGAAGHAAQAPVEPSSTP